MSLQNNIKWLLIVGAVIYIAKLWFDYKKVAVRTRGYPKTTGIMYLLIAFMTFTGVLSLSDKVLNWLFSQLGINLIDAEKLADNKLMLFIAFVVLAIATVFILKKRTSHITQQAMGYPSLLIFISLLVLPIANSKISMVNNGFNILFGGFGNTYNNNSTPPEVSKHFIKEAERKNQEIDVLKEKLKTAPSPQEKLELSSKINQLEAEKASLKEKIKTLEDRLTIARQRPKPPTMRLWNGIVA